MRRPIEPAEISYLQACGARLEELRRDAGLSQVELAAAAELSPSTIERIEGATRRTRRSTLDRVAAALERPEAAGELTALAGPALAPESSYAERIVRRRERRARRKRNRAAHAERVEAQERERVERSDSGSDLLTLARLYAHGSSAELAAYLRPRERPRRRAPS